jgi:UDP-N-acetylmuramoylalanine--D-glutamate ligase
VDVLRNPYGKHAVVIGGGKTGASAARLLKKLGARVTVCDDAAHEKVVAGLTSNGLDVASVDVRAGGIDGALVLGADLAVLSPGVPRAHASVQPALQQGVPVVNELELAAAHVPASVAIIGITGTNGKSTTTTMCGAIAKVFDGAAFVGGNLGTPWCQAVVEGQVSAVAVLELSSYQLETIRRLPLRAAVVTNLSPDHLDRYPNATAYYAAKARIFHLVVAGGGTSLNAADAETRTHLFPARARLPGDRLICDFDISMDVDDVDGVVVGPDRLVVRSGGSVTEVVLQTKHIVGHHNRQNAAAAVAAVALCGVPSSAWQAGLDAYGGIAHRLERIGERGGVAWLNDSKGTNVDATVTAVVSFPRGVHLIAGGIGKNTPYAPLVEVSRGRVRAVYTIGQDAPAIEAAFLGVVEVVPCKTLDVACREAHKRAVAGDVILLSPACASFDQFKDYAHRGETFRALFLSLEPA